MATWFLTIGNSDIQLLNGDYWNSLYGQNKKQEGFVIPRYFNNLKKMKDEATKRYIPPARVIGYLYGNASEHYNDLVFPLLDVFKEYFLQEAEKAIALDHVYVLLSDQSNIFKNDDLEDIYCPFWTDTCTLESLIRTYLMKELKLTEGQMTALTLKSQKEAEDQFSKGIDHWNEMLTVVETVLTDDLFTDSKIYVSHQAGTPAVSSAVQFVSINHGGAKVKFLVSNQFYDSDTKALQYKAEVIPSSSYWQKIQIIKAQKLLIDGNPSVAKELLTGLVDPDILEDLEKQVKQFNLKPDNSSSKEEFEPLRAADRVRKSLDLIEIFLRNENYLEAIALLAAAHETFLKTAILYLIRKNCTTQVNGIYAYQIVQWDKKGLFFKSKQDLLSEFGESLTATSQIDLSQALHFPQPQPAMADSAQDPDYITFFANNYLVQFSRNWDEHHNDFFIENICHRRKPRKKNTFFFSPKNFRLLLWLKSLVHQYIDDSQDWSWGILDWIGEYEREYNDDLRNQLVHNLRGIEKKHLLAYLKGEPQHRDRQDEMDDAATVFHDEIKVKFISVMSKIFLNDDGTPYIPNKTTNHIQEELEALSKSLK